jgi:hypothetical protein
MGYDEFAHAWIGLNSRIECVCPSETKQSQVMRKVLVVLNELRTRECMAKKRQEEDRERASHAQLAEYARFGVDVHPVFRLPRRAVPMPDQKGSRPSNAPTPAPRASPSDACHLQQIRSCRKAADYSTLSTVEDNKWGNPLLSQTG